MTRLFFAALVAACLPVSAAFAEAGAPGHSHAPAGLGKAGDAAKADRTINVTIVDNAYEPSEFSVKEGETIRFVIKNNGAFLHEFAISDPASIPEHQKMMQMMLDHGMITATDINEKMMSMPMEGHSAMAHDGSAGSVLLKPGAAMEMTWTFSKAAKIEIACTIPGHYESGMAAPVSFGE